MPHDFIPRRDAEFLGWSRNFSAQISAAAPDLGLTPAMAAHYASLHDAFAAANRLVQDPSTHTPPNVNGKNTARKAAEREARRLARIIQATTGVTDQQRLDLGLTVRTTNPSLVPAPHEPPTLFVTLRFGSTVRITLRDKGNTGRRGKPAGIAGAMVYSFVGQTPPDSLRQWTFQGNTTRPHFDLTLRGEEIVPGAQVWFSAYWYNPRGQRGPASMPKCTHIQYPTMMLGKALDPARTARLAA